MIQKLVKNLVFIVSLFAVSISFAQTGPKETLQNSIDTLLSEFSARRAELENDKAKTYLFAESIIQQSWDFPKMAQLVLGKNWRTIDDQQKEAFISAFKGLLIRTYSSAMFKQTGKESIKLKEPIYKGTKKNRAVISAEGSLGDGSGNVPLSFSMFQNKAAEWKIYNVAIAGVSLVTTYRSSYNQIIAAKGIDYLIASINKKAG